jgi:hypothetical protein
LKAKLLAFADPSFQKLKKKEIGPSRMIQITPVQATQCVVPCALIFLLLYNPFNGFYGVFGLAEDTETK